MGKWKPPAGTEWLTVPDWAHDDPIDRAAKPYRTAGGHNGMPELVPYRYRGTDFTEPDELDVTSRARPRPVAREATRWDDPTLAYAGLPFSRPSGWEAS